MKYVRLFFISSFCFLSNYLSGQAKIDTVACKVYEKSLTVVKNYLNGNDSNLNKTAKAITFLTFFTGIPSEDKGNYFGQFSPTENDLRRWSDWFTINKNSLYLDKSGNLSIQKSMKSPEY